MNTLLSMRLGMAALCLAFMAASPSAREQVTLNQNKAEAGDFGSMLRFNQATDNAGAGIQANGSSGYGRSAFGQNLFHGHVAGTVLGTQSQSLGGNLCEVSAC